jgi:hypothetical protein
MAKNLVEYQLADGSPVYVEVETPTGERVERVSRSGESAPERAQASFNEVIARLRPAADAVLQAFRGLNTPTEIVLEFGIKFNAKAGAIIASVDSEAVFKVSLNRLCCST